ncbi:hypothetical protein BV22DRAFT_1030512 [Leucogyrophana mollusca]|uniref:Uncharacterized protein n=1 Tax=Leucogyrophana mollusca TaxID=85980 RepID=A0ACB8BRI3_9AGAM|nr:hypothetical protein BV22DRAFT_1030512 [Leucogyrophana mollusca]
MDCTKAARALNSAAKEVDKTQVPLGRVTRTDLISSCHQRYLRRVGLRKSEIGVRPCQSYGF